MTGPDRRPAARLLGHRRGRAAASARLRRRVRQRRRHAERRLPAQRGPRHDRADRRRPHADVDREPLPEHRGDGAGPRDGHGGGPHPGRRPDRRDPRRGRGPLGLSAGHTTTRRHTMTTMTEPTTHTLEVPGAILTYDVRKADSSTAPVAVPDRLADGRRRVRDARRPLPRSHGRDLRPARRRAQHEGRSGQPVDARAARRRPPPDHRRARRRPGRPVREQRRRGERARPRGEAPGGRPDARRARAAARVDPARPRGRAGVTAGDRATRTSAAASAPAWRSSSLAVSHKGPIDAGLRRPAGAGSRRCSGCRPRTTATAPTRSSSRTSSTCTHYEPDFDALRAAPDPDRPGRRRRVGRPDGAPRRRRRRRAPRHRRR